MTYLPNAFDPPVWYLVMPVCGAGEEVFTRKRYADIVAAKLNSDQHNALVKVEDYLFLPSSIHIMIREGALTLDLWWQPFMDAVLEEIRQLAPDEKLSWCNNTYERIADAEAFDHRAYEMLFLPVWKGLATDPEGYAYNSVNNRAKIDLQ
ncbi:hypothetical protein [Chitinophaga pinensis]|uniref:Transposase IS200-like domain-containing protein n=1 Tax=Chitinophaga pinensis (strain ATCC 43595 / DSM 2588 / LMG 13176 / NBRC 15968 / NCIMB 11800 / UQM 2034) TaxID=485918 RepID=A0A979G0B4_CHIPD|nr:hypothetical protein [Chitinophaga pinensis]ACU58418.1 hypothetical protein Cpin_0920 [Chitinophaga pinensis DSM 2588]